MYTTKEEQILAIKKRLNEAVDKINISTNKLKDELNDKYGYEINYETLNNTLNLSKPKSLDTICVIALCRYFNLDTAFVLSEPNNPNSEIYTNENQFVSERFAILSDPKYLGDYYGYFYSPKKTNNLINNFHLKINKEYGKAVARLTINYHSYKDNGQLKQGEKELIGTPIMVKPSNIYIVFTEGKGQFILFSFSYVLYNENTLYFRRGAMITQGRDAARHPLMQSFVMLNKELSQENIEQYIPGFLLLYDTDFHLPAHKLKELSKNHPEVARIFDEFGYIFQANQELYYKVNETQILASVRNNIPKQDVVKALQLMKANATDATRIYFPEIDEFSEFSKFLK